jgi:uncharacterized protein (DUF1697 family)
MTRYIALLRGINVGGHKKIKMADLHDLLGSVGFENTKTVLASGNVAFDSDENGTDILETTIEQAIVDKYGFSVSVIVFPQSRIAELVESEPFAGIEVTKETRLYVTFLRSAPETQIEVPYHTETGDFTILRVSDTNVCSVLTINNTRSVDGMAVLEKLYGKAITTRNWNTILKLADL